MLGGLLDLLPLWGVFLASVAAVLLSVEGGYRLGRWRGLLSPEKESPVGAMVAATLGLLAFLLAFTFGVAASRFDDRRQVLLEEANAIGTAHLRAGLLAERHRDEVRKLLDEYVDVRLAGVQREHLESSLRRSGQLHELLWAHTAEAATEHAESPVVALFVESINAVIDVHSKRVQIGLRSRIPATIWGALYVIAFLGLSAMGYHSGLAGTNRSLAMVAVALAFSVVMLLITDLDRPQEGLMRVSQQAMLDLRNSLRGPGG